jgi:tetratricopeptide (TPR) repeat protein
MRALAAPPRPPSPFAVAPAYVPRPTPTPSPPNNDSLLYRADQNYSEAIKCYRNAVRFDPQNQQILRDLATLQVQVRDLAGFVDTRSALLNLRPQARTNWLALAVAHHLAGSHDVAAEVLRAYESTQEGPGCGGAAAAAAGSCSSTNKSKPRLTPQQLSDAYEASELVLYRGSILREAGRPKDAVAWLRERRAEVRDTRGLASLEAGCLLDAAAQAEAQAEQKDKEEEAASLRASAATAYRAMLRDNADDLDAHRGLRCALGLLPAASASGADANDNDAADHGGPGGGGGGGAHEDALLTEAQRTQLRALYAGLRAEFPRSGAVGRVPLDFEVGGTAQFSAAAEAYVRRPLERGVPSLFSDLRPLYADVSKAEALGKLMEGLRAAVEAGGGGGRLPPLSAAAAAAAAGEADDEAKAAAAKEAAANNASSPSSDAGADEEDADVAPPPCPTGWLAASLKKEEGSSSNGGGDGNGGDNSSPLDDEGGVKTWLLHYLTQHYDELGRTADALTASDAAMASSGGRVPELWLARARLLKRAGDTKGAAAAAARASALDPSDRYLNSMAARYLLSAGDVVTAQRAAGVFTRGTGGAAEAAAAAPDDPHAEQAAADAAAASLAEMQHSWFELREAEARLDQQDYGRSLKHFRSVAQHFAEFVDDQLDFHQWCLRRSTLRQYVGLIRLADRVRAHPQHARAVWGAVRSYCALADAKSKDGGGAGGGGGGGGANGQQQGAAGGTGAGAGAAAAASAPMTAEERKKEQLRRKKEQKAAERAEAERKEQQQKQQQAASREAGGGGGGGGGGGSKQQRAAAAAAKPADPDPDGAKLAAVDDPMAEAAKFVQVLSEHAPGRLLTQRCAFETYLRRGKPVLALAAAERAAAIAGPRNPEAFRMAVRLALALLTDDAAAGSPSSPCAAAAAKHPVVGQVVREGVARLLSGGGGRGGGGNAAAEPVLSRARVQAFVDAYAQAADAPAPVPATAVSCRSSPVARPSPLDARAGRADDPRSSPLARRATAAEMMAVVSPSSRDAALALLLGSSSSSSPPTHADCVAVHRLLLPANGGALADAAAADKWRAHAAKLFPWSGYFGSGGGGGGGGGAAAVNGAGNSNGSRVAAA